MIPPRLFHVRLVCWLLLAVLIGTMPLRADETVRQVQEELRKRNLYFGDIDGRATPEVNAALRRYQQHKGFAATGDLDETTLRSLIDETTLRTLNPRLAQSPGVANAPSAPVAASPWPDITVMRSDEGPPSTCRRMPPPSTQRRSSHVHPRRRCRRPPPGRRRPPCRAPGPISTPYALFSPATSRPGQTNDVPGELAFYGDHVDYFNEGVVDRRFIEGDAARYDRRWPQRRFTLLDPLTLSDAPDNDPQKVVVHFRYAFVNKGPRYTVEGKADNAFTLQAAGPDGLRIVGMKEQRVRKE